MKTISSYDRNVVNYGEEFEFIFRVNVSEGVDKAKQRHLLAYDPAKVEYLGSETDYREGEPGPYGLVFNGAATKFIRYKFKADVFARGEETKILVLDYDGNVLETYNIDIVRENPK